MKPLITQTNIGFFLLAAAVGSLFLAAPSLRAATTDVWNGGGVPDGNWSNPANWSGTAPNAGGDNLFFQGGVQPLTTNDFINLASWVQLNSSVPFTISGSGLTIANGLTNSAQNNVWNAPLTNMSSQNFDVAANTTLTIDTNVLNNVSIFTITKTSGGTLVFAGAGDDSNMQGFVSGGTLVLNKTSSSTVHALEGSVETINSGGMLQLSGTGGDQILDTAEVVVNSGGTFDLNGQSETIAQISLNGTGIGGAGAIINSSATAATLTLNGSASSLLVNNATLGGVGDIAIVGTSPLGNGNGKTLMKIGNNMLTLANGNGLDNNGLYLTVNGGKVILAKNNLKNTAHAVGGLTVNSGLVQLVGTNGEEIYENAYAIVNSGGVLDMNGQNQTFVNPMTINGTGIGGGGVLINNNSVNNNIGLNISQLTGPLNMGSDSFVGGSGDLVIAGVLGGSGKALTKVGTGGLLLAYPNTYSGNTTVSSGILALYGTGSINSSPVITVAPGAVFDVGTYTGIAYGGTPFSLGASQILSGSGYINGNVIATKGGIIIPGGATTLSTLNFNNNLTISGTAFIFGFDPASGNHAQVSVLGTLTNNGTSTIILSCHSLSAGTYTLMTYASLVGTGTFVLGGNYQNVTLTAGATALTLTVGTGGSPGGNGNLTWVGDGVANNWDLTTTNWLLFGELATFYQADTVTFDNTGSSTPAINLTTTLSPNSVTVNSMNNYTFSGSGQLAGAMSLTKNGTGTLVMATANSYTGGTAINAGTTQLGNGGTIGNAGTGTITLASGNAGVNGTNSCLIINETGSPVFPNALSLSSGNQAICVNAGQTAIFTNNISGSGQLWVNGSGTLVISNQGGSTFSGGTMLANSAQGGLQIDALSEVGPAGLYFQAGGGTVVYTGPSVSVGPFGGNALPGGTNVFNIANPATTLTLSSALTGGAPGAIVKSGLGILALSAVNSYNANTVVRNGTLALIGAGSINSSPSVNVAANAIFDVSGVSFSTANILGGSGSINGAVTISAGGEIAPGILWPGSTLTFSNNVTFSGTAILALGLAPTPSGTNDLVNVLGTVENDGTVMVPLNYFTGTLSAGTYTLMTYASLTGSGTFALDSCYPNVTLNVGSTALTLTVGPGGSIINNLTWMGDGVANNWDLTTADWVNSSGATTSFNPGAFATFNNTGSSKPAINLTATMSPGSVIVNSSSNYTFSGSGQLAGAMSLTKNGTGTLVMATANSYTNGTTIANGTVQLGNGGTIGNVGTGTINLVSGNAGVNGANSCLTINETGSHVFPNALSLSLGNQAICVNAGQTAIFTNTVGGSGQLWVNGSGTLVISNQGGSTYSGGTMLANSAQGGLQIDDLSELGTGGLYFQAAGGTLVYAGPSNSSSESGNTLFQFQGGTNVISVANPATTLTISSAMTGTGIFDKSGPGTLALSGLNSYTATTVIINGRMSVDGALSSPVIIYSNAVLGGSGVVFANVTVQAGGIVQGGDKNYSGTFTLSQMTSVAPSLSLGTTNGAAVSTYSRFNIATGGMIYTPVLNVNGTNTVIILDSTLSVGTYPLIGYNSINYTNGGAFKLGNLPAGVVANLQDTGSSIQLVVKAINAVPPSFGGVTLMSDQSMELTFSGYSGASYTVYASTNLALPLASWTVVGTGTFGADPVMFQDRTATNYPARFYIISMP